MPALLTALVDQMKLASTNGLNYADIKTTECYAGVCQSIEQYLGGRLAKWTCPKLSSILCAAGAVVTTFPNVPDVIPATKAPLVSPIALTGLIELNTLLAGSQHLQDIAFSYPERNRVFGSKAHNDTVKWIHDTLANTGYYDISIQPFTEIMWAGTTILELDAIEVPSTTFTYSPSVNVTQTVVAVANEGCRMEEFPESVAGKVALILRGFCSFGTKAINAKKAGAAAVIIYDNVKGDEPLSGTLGGPSDDYAPVAGVTNSVGLSIYNQLVDGHEVTAKVVVDSIARNTTSMNVIAETKMGDHDNVIALGAHTDSVEAGPGINDDGSGTVALLTVASELSKFSINNAVRFCFWSGEEEGLLGSTYYVNSIKNSSKELNKIRAFMDFDMVASPNYILAVYDGSGRAFNTTGPPGSTEMQDHFQKFFESHDYNHIPTAFDGRSDYGPFLEVGIASGGVFTGAEEIKTDEWVELFGGTAGIQCDPCYHLVCDTMTNLNHEAYLIGTKAIADSVAAYAASMAELGPKANITERAQWVSETRDSGMLHTMTAKRRGKKALPQL